MRHFDLPRAAVRRARSTASRWTRSQPLRDVRRPAARYCWRVASAVGLICIEIFGYRDPTRARLRREPRHRAAAHQHPARRRRGRRARPHLSAAGRPARFGCTDDGPARGTRHGPASVELLAFEAARARDYYARGRGAADRARRAARWSPPRSWRAIYREMLDRIERAGYDVFSERIRVPARARRSSPPTRGCAPVRPSCPGLTSSSSAPALPA